MLEILEQADLQLFLFLNRFYSDFWDSVMIFFSKKLVWIPLYAAVLFLLYKKFGLKKALIILLFYALLITLADQISLFLKQNTHRLRPCHDPRLADTARFLKTSGSKYGFVSGHASNTFAFAVFTALLLKQNIIAVILLLWASTVAYSRIYLGVHFPGDVISGIFLGTFIACLLYKSYIYADKRFLGKKENKPPDRQNKEIQ